MISGGGRGLLMDHETPSDACKASMRAQLSFVSQFLGTPWLAAHSTTKSRTYKAVQSVS